jgi:hypothetical protein
MLFHKLFLLITFLFVTLFSSNVFSSQFQNTTNGGIALAVGDGSEPMNPGINLSLEPLTRVHHNFGIGGFIDYTWLSVDVPLDDDIRAGTHLWNICAVPKLIAPIASNLEIYFDVDPGVSLVLAYLNADYFADRKFKAFFGLSIKTGIYFNNFNFEFKFKSTFNEGDAAKFICLNVGSVFKQ